MADGSPGPQNFRSSSAPDPMRPPTTPTKPDRKRKREPSSTARNPSKKINAPANVTENSITRSPKEKFLQDDLPRLEQARSEEANKLRRKGQFKPQYGAYGVNVVDFAPGTDNKGKLAGYLGLSNAQQVGDVWAAMLEPLQTLMEAYKISYDLKYARTDADKRPPETNIDKPLSVAIRPEEMFRLVRNKAITLQDVDATEIDAKRFPKNDANNNHRMYLYIMKYVHSVLKDFKENLPKSLTDLEIDNIFSGQHVHKLENGSKYQANTSKFKLLDKHDPEDVYRALLIFQHYRMTLHKANYKTTTPSVSKGSVKLPVFYLDDHVEQTDRQAALQNHSLQQLEMSTENNFACISTEEVLSMWAKGKEMNKEDNLKELDKVWSLSTQPHGKHMDRMTPALRAAVSRLLTGRSRVLYDDPKNQDKLLMDIIEKDALAKISPLVDELHAAKQDAQDNPFVSVDHSLFLARQRNLNDYGATPPSLQECDERLHGFEMQLDLPEKDPVTGEKYSFVHFGMSLKPWQPQAILWMTEAAESKIRACICADGTGTGKTVSSYATQVELSARLEIQRKAWINARSLFIAYIRKDWSKVVGDCVKVLQRQNEVLGHFDASNEVSEDTISDDQIWDCGHHLNVGFHQQWDDWRKRQDVVVPEKCPRHRPFLIVGPPTSIPAWMNDSERYKSDGPRNIEIATFCGLGNKKGARQYQNMAITPANAEKVSEWINGLDPDDPQTSRMGLLTTFQAWHRAMQTEAVGMFDETTKKALPTDERDGEVDDSAEAEAEQDESEILDDNGVDKLLDDDDDPDKPSKSTRKKIFTFKDGFNPGSFSTVYVDEAHRVKNHATMQTQAIYNLAECAFILLTATPAKQSVADFSGLLRFIFKNIAGTLPDDVEKAPNLESYRQMYESFMQKYDGRLTNIPDDKLQHYLAFLNPDNFRALMTNKASEDVNYTRQIQPLPYSLCVLRRVQGSTIKIRDDLPEVVVGAEIPGWKMVTVECRMDANQDMMYRAIIEDTKRTDSKLVIPDLDAENEEAAFRKTPARRRLVIGSYNPLFDLFFQRRLHPDAEMVHKYASGGVDSFTMIYHWTKGDIWSFTPSNRVEAINHLVAPSIKNRKLSQLLDTYVLNADPAKRKKLLIWANEPIVLMQAEILLALFEVKYAVVRAGKTAAERVNAENAFNHDPDTMVLLSSSLSCTESSNYQYGCHVQVWLEPVSGTNAQQMIGRTFRIGQEEEQIIYVFYGDETFDQVQFAQYLKKYRGMLSASVEIPQDLIDKAIAQMSKEQEADDTGVSATTAGHTSMMDLAKGRYREAYLNAIIRQMFGLRSDRIDPAWLDAFAPDLKNKEPQEVIYRLACGGNVADAVFQQLKDDSVQVKKEKDDLPLAQPGEQPTVLFRDHEFARLGTSFKKIEPISAADYPAVYRHMIGAAEQLAAKDEYKLMRMDPQTILEAAHAWVPKGCEPYLLEGAIQELKNRDKPPADDDDDNHKQASTATSPPMEPEPEPEPEPMEDDPIEKSTDKSSTAGQSRLNQPTSSFPTSPPGPPSLPTSPLRTGNSAIPTPEPAADGLDTSQMFDIDDPTVTADQMRPFLDNGFSNIAKLIHFAEEILGTDEAELATIKKLKGRQATIKRIIELWEAKGSLHSYASQCEDATFTDGKSLLKANTKIPEPIAGE